MLTSGLLMTTLCVSVGIDLRIKCKGLTSIKEIITVAPPVGGLHN